MDPVYELKCQIKQKPKQTLALRHAGDFFLKPFKIRTNSPGICEVEIQGKGHDFFPLILASFFLFERIHSLNDPSLLKSPNFKEWENSAIEGPSQEAFPTPLRLVVLSFGCIVEIPGKLKKNASREQFNQFGVHPAHRDF